MEKKNSYDSFWLNADMENMGFLFEYCDKFAKRLYGIEYFDKVKFIKAFMLSDMRKWMDIGHPKLCSEAAVDSFKKFIEVDCNGDILQFRCNKEDVKHFMHYEMYWVGWAYAYIHYKEDIYSADMFKKLPLEEMLRQYTVGHEMDIKLFYEKIRPIFDE